MTPAYGLLVFLCLTMGGSFMYHFLKKKYLSHIAKCFLHGEVNHRQSKIIFFFFYFETFP